MEDSRDICSTCEHSRKPMEEDLLFDKQFLSPIKNEDFTSFYDGVSMVSDSCAPDASPSCPTRRTLDCIDASSRDSGYGMGFQTENGRFLSYMSPSKPLSFSSGSCFMEDEFLETFTEIQPIEKASELPNDFSKLINEPLEMTPQTREENDTVIGPLFGRVLALQSPPTSKVRMNLFFEKNDENKENNRSSSKRSEHPTDLESTAKKTKILYTPQPKHKRNPLFQRQVSSNEQSIMCAVQRSSNEPNLIGDFSKSYCLPLTNGKHQDLKAITPETLAKLMRGEFKDTVQSFKVIDCRYPYEFLGGHIIGAINIYTKEQVCELLHESQILTNNSGKRQILVFHCEFSSERGPNLYRHLRKEDRTRNISEYPLLNYPEIYLLEGGYKNFFLEYSEMCVPVAYKQMLHPDHKDDLKHFRQKSKTWNVDNRQKNRHGKPSFNF